MVHISNQFVADLEKLAAIHTAQLANDLSIFEEDYTVSISKYNTPDQIAKDESRKRRQVKLR